MLRCCLMSGLVVSPDIAAPLGIVESPDIDISPAIDISPGIVLCSGIVLCLGVV